MSNYVRELELAIDSIKSERNALREVVREAIGAYGLQAIRDRHDKELLEGWVKLIDKATAALR